MQLDHHQFQACDNAPEALQVDVTIVMPCLNETISLPHCIGNALDALSEIRERLGLSGEIVIADNGSSDGSQALAESLGARVVQVSRRGYGAALIGGCEAAYGRYVLMGDCDGSYDFTEGVDMIARLVGGAELCMGSRFRGGIAPGAMPWKNRHIGNPALTGILNLFFRSGIGDAHCGLRAIRKDAFTRLGLTSSGMEFASEMVIKSALLKLRIEEVPATLSPDLRKRAPHLRPWRDGWRHLRYLLMLAPNWVFGVPALLAIMLGSLLLGASAIQYAIPGSFATIGDYWTLVASALLTTGHLALLLTLAGQVYALRAGYRRPGPVSRVIGRLATLENLLMAGLAGMVAGASVLGYVYVSWVERDYAMATSIFLPVIGILLVSAGMQNVLGGFLLAIIGGNEAKFLAEDGRPAPTVPANRPHVPAPSSLAALQD